MLRATPISNHFCHTVLAVPTISMGCATYTVKEEESIKEIDHENVQCLLCIGVDKIPWSNLTLVGGFK